MSEAMEERQREDPTRSRWASPPRGALLLAGCGAANETGSSGGSGAPARLAAALTARSPVPARAPSRPPCRPGSPASRSQPGRHHQLRPERLGRRAHPVHRRRRRLRGQRRLHQGRRAHQGRSALRRRRRRGARPTSRRSRSSTTSRASQTCSSRRDDRQIFDGKITNWNDPAIAADNPGVRRCRTRRSPRCTASDESGTTQNFTDYLNKARPRPLDGPGRRHLADPGRRGRAGHLRRHRRGEGRQRHDRLRRREPGRRPRRWRKIKVGDACVGPTPEAAAKVLDASQARRAAAATERSPSTLDRDHHRGGHLPDRRWSPTRSPARSTPTRPRPTW